MERVEAGIIGLPLSGGKSNMLIETKEKEIIYQRNK